ncbi:UreE urease accessory domain-containing protein [Sulfobacillus acidophilus DSM 10332]|uniref:UreE urease accessory domain-containing protein n=1 Tax=Sulfobacillus acidophilus (strain ATCC 700253 / DSM 10332 / NAL) TaxID=679936 RepID=G8TTD1_SULAD|nr:UreE urease accessory domain-containing protein [Sulfobacillus acidophilus DSM 10332]
MTITEVIRGETLGEKARLVERVRLSRRDALRPFGKVVTDYGRTLMLALPRGVELVDGDVLYQDSDLIILVEIIHPSVVAIRLPDYVTGTDRLIYGMQLGHALGNQHLPVRVVPPGIFRVPVDEPERLLRFLQRSAFADVQVDIVAGEADDPVPNAEAHV